MPTPKSAISNEGTVISDWQWWDNAIAQLCDWQEAMAAKKTHRLFGASVETASGLRASETITIVRNAACENCGRQKTIRTIFMLPGWSALFTAVEKADFEELETDEAYDEFIKNNPDEWVAFDEVHCIGGDTFRCGKCKRYSTIEIRDSNDLKNIIEARYSANPLQRADSYYSRLFDYSTDIVELFYEERLKRWR